MNTSLAFPLLCGAAMAGFVRSPHLLRLTSVPDDIIDMAPLYFLTAAGVLTVILNAIFVICFRTTDVNSFGSSVIAAGSAASSIINIANIPYVSINQAALTFSRHYHGHYGQRSVFHGIFLPFHGLFPSGQLRPAGAVSVSRAASLRHSRIPLHRLTHQLGGHRRHSGDHLPFVRKNMYIEFTLHR